MFKRFAAVLLVLNFPFSVFAQQVSDPKEEAKKHFDAGSALYEKAAYKEAVVEFQKSYTLFPHADLLYNIGRCYEKDGNIPAALRFYKEYLRAVPGAVEVQESIRNLERRLRDSGVQQIRVYSIPPGAVVSIDGERMGVTPFSTEVKPGKYILSLSKEGYAAAGREVVVASEKSLEVEISLEEKTQVRMGAPSAGEKPKGSEKGDTMRNWGIGLTFSGVGVAAVGGVMTAMAFGARDDQKNAADAKSLNDARDRVEAFNGAAIGCYVAGAAIAVTGVVLWIVGAVDGNPSKPQKFSALPFAGDGTVGIAVAGGW